MSEPGAALITAVISTRDRGDRVVRTARDLLSNEGVAFELIVVDQSEDDRTRDAMAALLDDSRLQYLRSTTAGLARGRNLGIAAASTGLIAVTDDDCEVPSDWLRRIVAIFAAGPKIGVVFGNVLPGPHDARSEIVTGYVREKPFLATQVRDKLEVEGIAACLAFRREVWNALGGFDAMLGLGSRLGSAEEADFALRALRAGRAVFETPELAVIHNGLRPRKSLRELIQRNWYGTGAVFGKHLKQHPLSTAALLARMAGRFVFSGSPPALAIGDVPHRAPKLAAFLRGLTSGVLTPADPRSGHFIASHSSHGEASRNYP